MRTKAGAWFQTWWSLVPGPRGLSLVFTLLYAVAWFTGVITLLVPPVSLSAQVGGPAIMASVGWLMAAGALIGMIGGAREFWKVERIGLGLMTWGLSIYLVIVLSLHFTTPGSRLTQTGIILMALLSLLIRYLMIWRYAYRPRG